MDKLKAYLGVLKKHHFWILCCVIAAVGILLWYGAASAVTKKFLDSKGKLEAAFANVAKIPGVPAHPNASFATGVEKSHKDLQKEIQGTWDDLYNRQKAIPYWDVDKLGA